MRARHECLQLARLSLFNLEISRALRLEDFEHIQNQHRTRLNQFLRESWQPAIKKVPPPPHVSPCLPISPHSSPYLRISPYVGHQEGAPPATPDPNLLTRTS